MYIDYRCPQCGEVLRREDNSLRCENRHCFDLAREGYINLHLVQDKKSKQPGDSIEMLRARRSFLEQKHYSPLVKKLTSILRASLPHGSTLLDIGCGEGYYLEYLCNELQCKGLGIDIAKEAVRMATKRRFGAQLAVSSSNKLPYFDGSVDAAICVFSPISVTEIKRVLKPGAPLLMVGPGERHLHTLATLVYQKAKPHRANFEAFSQLGIEPVDSQQVTFELRLKGDDAENLLKMTPYYWSASPENRASLSAELSNAECHFQINHYVFQ
jgi:23S rRNA (guanine745-N1)-methyltransferase